MHIELLLTIQKNEKKAHEPKTNKINSKYESQIGWRLYDSESICVRLRFDLVNNFETVKRIGIGVVHLFRRDFLVVHLL